jgi:hypothetical protein
MGNPEPGRNDSNTNAICADVRKNASSIELLFGWVFKKTNKVWTKELDINFFDRSRLRSMLWELNILIPIKPNQAIDFAVLTRAVSRWRANWEMSNAYFPAFYIDFIKHTIARITTGFQIPLRAEMDWHRVSTRVIKLPMPDINPIEHLVPKHLLSSMKKAAGMFENDDPLAVELTWDDNPILDGVKEYFGEQDIFIERAHLREFQILCGIPTQPEYTVTRNDGEINHRKFGSDSTSSADIDEVAEYYERESRKWRTNGGS